MTSQQVDLDPATRQALAYDRLLELVAEGARTPMGTRYLSELAPRIDRAAIESELDLIDELILARAGGERWLESELPDPAPSLELLAVPGAIPAATALRDLASVLQAAARLRRSIARLDPGRFASLRQVGSGLPDLGTRAEEILAGIDPEGELTDEASPALRSLRRARVRVAERLERLLRGMLHRPGAEPVIQDDFITQRNGRMVIPVRTDAPRKPRGIMHATSSSGATQFIEPLESLDLNNERVRLAEQEVDEIRRILDRWASGLREHLDGVRAAVEAVARLDGLGARARFAERHGCVRPVFCDSGALQLSELRHPLLDDQLREEGLRCVPLSFEIDPWDQVLVISGPNAGGKTVALKSLGLAVLMAQSGIPIPARQARLPLYGQLRADIGDHQSIQANLSTFSAHVRAVAGFLEGAAPPSLMLFDEIGSGTEPGEGAALACAVLEELLARGITAVATTHHEALKAWAVVTEGARIAAMEFDQQTLQPTFRILMEMAGVSAGLEIALKLGLDPSVVARARGSLGDERERTEAYTRRLRELTAGLERRHEAQARREAEWRAHVDRRRRDEEAERRRRAKQAESDIGRIYDDFRQAANRELAALSAPERRERAMMRRSAAERRLAGRRKAAEHAVGAKSQPDAPEETWVRADEVAPGSTVRVRALGREGQVVSVDGERVKVRLGGLVMAVRRAELQVRAGGAGASTDDVDRGARGPATSGGWAAALSPDRAATGELKLLGERVDDALERLDRFLDDAVRSELEEVRVVHGHGTGRLKAAVRKHLAGHPQVESHRPGRPGEGGDGATVVRLGG